MTRVNAGIEVEKLTDQHLFSEYRELGRIPTLLIDRLIKNKSINPPCNFKLNKGHMIFFLDKGKYIVDRFNEICQEMRKRNMYFSHSYHKSFFIYNHYPQYYNDWEPNDKDREIVKERISTRILNSSQKPKIYKRKICPHYYIEHILNS